MFVLDSRATPMRIIASYDKTTIHGNGCGGVESGGRMYVNSGGGTAANLSEFDVYAFNLAEFRNAAGTGSCAGPAPNLPAPKLVVSQDDREADSHGAVLDRRRALPVGRGPLRQSDRGHLHRDRPGGG